MFDQNASMKNYYKEMRYRVYAGRPARVGHALTPRQQEIYGWYYESTRRAGFQPSYRDTAEHFEVGVNAIFNSLVSAADKGWVQFARRSRGIQFLLRPNGTPFRGFSDLP